MRYNINAWMYNKLKQDWLLFKYTPVHRDMIFSILLDTRDMFRE